MPLYVFLFRNTLTILFATILYSNVLAQTDTVINAYATVTGSTVNGCNLVDLTVDNSTGFKAGDEVLIIQMKGAVFTSGNVEEGWDGRYNGGIPHDIGVYYYVVEGKKNNGERNMLKGSFTLIR